MDVELDVAPQENQEHGYTSQHSAPGVNPIQKLGWFFRNLAPLVLQGSNHARTGGRSLRSVSLYVISFKAISECGEKEP